MNCGNDLQMIYLIYLICPRRDDVFESFLLSPLLQFYRGCLRADIYTLSLMELHPHPRRFVAPVIAARMRNFCHFFLVDQIP